MSGGTQVPAVWKYTDFLSVIELDQPLLTKEGAKMHFLRAPGGARISLYRDGAFPAHCSRCANPFAIAASISRSVSRCAASLARR